MFPEGLVVYFRLMAANNQMACSMHLKGRDVVLRDNSHDESRYKILDAHGNLLGIYERDFVAAILPIQSEGPGNVD